MSFYRFLGIEVFIILPGTANKGLVLFLSFDLSSETTLRSQAPSKGGDGATVSLAVIGDLNPKEKSFWLKIRKRNASKKEY